MFICGKTFCATFKDEVWGRVPKAQWESLNWKLSIEETMKWNWRPSYCCSVHSAAVLSNPNVLFNKATRVRPGGGWYLSGTEKSYLKRQCREIFILCLYFHPTTFPGAKRCFLGQFEFLTLFHEGIKILNRLCGVGDTGEWIRKSWVGKLFETWISCYLVVKLNSSRYFFEGFLR